ncbi:MULTISPECIES: hypothetical protein [unclassified Streptomyces]|uniref:hypothetical protein n=1 Tax=unclassified Streptomyces TaxID=2593676 RepID=UPI0037FEAF48
MRRTTSVLVGAIVLLGVLAPTASADEPASGNVEQQITGSSANPFDGNSGPSGFENAGQPQNDMSGFEPAGVEQGQTPGSTGL